MTFQIDLSQNIIKEYGIVFGLLINDSECHLLYNFLHLFYILSFLLLISLFLFFSHFLPHFSQLMQINFLKTD